MNINEQINHLYILVNKFSLKATTCNFEHQWLKRMFRKLEPDHSMMEPKEKVSLVENDIN